MNTLAELVDQQPGQAIATTLEKRWKKFRKEFKKTRRALSEEVVHDTRVASRKILSMLMAVDSVIGGKKTRRIEQNIEEALDSLSPLRDAQVELDGAASLEGRDNVMRRFHSYLLKRERKLQSRAQRSIRKIDTTTIKKDLRAIEKQLERKKSDQRTNAKLLGRILEPIDDAFAKVLRYRRNLDPVEVTTLHCLRIAFKEYRYMLEALQPLLHGFDEKTLSSLKNVQDLLGELHDLEVLSATLCDFVEDQNIARNASIVPMQKDISARHHRLLQKFLDVVDDILESWQTWSKLGSARVRIEFRGTINGAR